VLLRRAWLLGSLVLGCLFVAFIYLHVSTPYYRSTSAVQVEQEAQRVFKPDNKAEEADDDLKDDDILKTIEQNFQSPGLFLNVAVDPSIRQDPQLFVGISPQAEPLSTSDLAEILQAHTRATLRRGTRLIDVSVDHPVPEVAQKLCRAVVHAYIEQNRELSTSTSTDTEGLLQADSDGMKDQLQKSEDALATYREVLLLKDRISDQQRIIDSLAQRYRAKHPTMIQARTLMTSLVTDFDRDVKQIRTQSLESGYWAEQDPILEKLSPQQRIETELQLVEARTNVLEGEVETERSLFNSVLKQSSEATISKGAAPTAVLVRDNASLPQRPVWPKRSVVMVLGLAAGLGLALAALLLLEAFDSSFKTAEDVEQYLGLSVLGAVPEIVPPKGKVLRPSKMEAFWIRNLLRERVALLLRPSKNEALRDPVILVSDPGSIAAESFRTLRASLGLLGKKEDHRTLLFTSALASEGKTFVSGNYAVSLAQQGVKTLLIDTDLRVPAVHQFFGLENQRGLVDHVAHGLPLEKVIQTNVVSNLDVITTGSRCPNPAEFLSGSGFAETLAKVLPSYERVIIDCSPINLVSDPLLLISMVQSVVLVVRANQTPRRDARYALNTLQRAGVEPIGVVINAVPNWTQTMYYSHPGRYSGGEKYFRAYS
jgi:capsular exopolysaccharide synthesis family protein